MPRDDGAKIVNIGAKREREELSSLQMLAAVAEEVSKNYTPTVDAKPQLLQDMPRIQNSFSNASPIFDAANSTPSASPLLAERGRTMGGVSTAISTIASSPPALLERTFKDKRQGIKNAVSQFTWRAVGKQDEELSARVRIPKALVSVMGVDRIPTGTKVKIRMKGADLPELMAKYSDRNSRAK
jgi:hypothetical protein